MKDEDGFGPNFYGLDKCHECGKKPFSYFKVKTFSIARVLSGNSRKSEEDLSVVVFCRDCDADKGIWVLHFDNWFDEVSAISKEEALLIYVLKG